MFTKFKIVVENLLQKQLFLFIPMVKVNFMALKRFLNLVL